MKDLTDETMPLDDMRESMTAPPATDEICVPSTALAIAAEDGGEDALPEAGDHVSVTIEGKVTRSENGQVYFKPEKANGEDMGGKPMAETSMEDEAAQLRGALSAEPQREY